jgi:site-specific recombinase XerD
VKRCENVAFHRFGYQHAVRIRQVLTAKYAPATVNRVLSAWRQVMREAWRLGLMGREAMERAADVPRVRGRAVARGVWLRSGEIRALFDACRAGGGADGARDAAILVLGLACGLRREEMVNLDVGDVDLVADTVHVHGKGGVERVLPLGAAAPVLQRWLDVRGIAPGPLLTGLSSRSWGKRLAPRTIFRVVGIRAKQAGLPAGLSPHSLRKTCATSLLAKGVDLLVVQRMLGHASVETTKLYDLRGEIAQREAQARLTFDGLED